MSRSPWLAASVLSLALLAIPFVPARAAKPVPPPPTPTITAILLGGAGGGPAIFAAASDGRIFMARYNAWDYPGAQPYQEVAQLPAKPVSMQWLSWGVLVCLENGDIYRSDSSVPITFAFVENVFTSAGARLPAFPDLGAFEDSRPILTNEPELDAPGAVK